MTSLSERAVARDSMSGLDVVILWGVLWQQLLRSGSKLSDFVGREGVVGPLFLFTFTLSTQRI